MNRRFLTLITLLLSMTAAVFASGDKIRVACVGNSITYGYLVEDREHNAWPFKLQTMLGDKYEVGNFGKSRSTLLEKGHYPYVNQPEYKAALEFKPDIVVIHLGVNDTDPRNWPNLNGEFVTDYVRLIDSFRKVNPNVRVMIALLSPLSAKHYRFRSGTRDWRLEIQQKIMDVAKATGAELIDFNEPLRDHQNLLPDGIHPNAEGEALLAEAARAAITGDYGGLKLPAVYQSGMVLQRNRPLTFHGKADAGSRITLTLDNRTYHATTNNRGKWSITTAPIVTGPEYTLSISDGKETVTLTDILAGEVWLATGQSNMELTLRASTGGKELIAASADDGLRIYNQKEIARTDNVLWSDSICDLMDHLKHFRPAKWEKIGPANAGNFSAVAYNFARALRDSLQVPVGIICNAVGGSPIESWIDVNTLEEKMPEVLVNWRKNDYLMPWVQQRVGENIGNRPAGRHPYEPSYLYAAALRELEGLPIAGAIWYQGESNGHNPYLYKQLFPLLAESWRKAFASDSMPIYFVQLSSINRSSWPEFRNMQRELSRSVPHTGMAVTHDVGDSLDVHPRDKRPVGNRLARLALNRTYGMADVVCQGPEVSSAIAGTDGRVTLTMDTHGSRLMTSDGHAPRTFEVAEIEGIYYPATAVINGNEITISNMEVKKPRYVRYGWQPFTRANVTNSEGIPTSTFAMEVDNASDYDVEAGMEVGISAPFAGMLDGQLITAGGCNFPVDPMGPASTKKFYKGVYAADPATMQWQRIGSLPEGMAYGATAPADGGLILIGGTSASEALRDVNKLTVADGKVTLAPLPQLPAAVDNMAAAAIGSKVYVAGGNVAGKPSRQLFVLDLDNLSAGWKKLRDMPGNPRVQPAMAAAKDANGEVCLYLWGGFAGKHDGKQATLETDGLKYTPSKGKWSELPAPVDAQGNPISTGGGTAATMTDGRIAVAGGVNKEVFLEALRNQAPDYLQHPIEWYRFNDNVLLFNPATGTWSIDGTDKNAARAGAVMIADQNNGFYLIGGELKPRIRTAETLHITLK